MSLSNEDWIEVLDHLRLRVREAGFADLDERLTLDFQPTNQGRTDFLRYLSSLISGLTERSYTCYSRALETLQSALEIEGGNHVEGIEVIFDEADSRLYGTHQIN